MIKTNVTDKRPRREKYKQEIILVSGGFAKPEAFPGGKITVYPWDSAIDAWLTEQANRATGPERDRVLYDLMAKVCNLNGCPLEDFVIGDVNAVLMVSRSIQNRNVIQYLARCPKCSHENIDEILVPNELRPIAQKKPDYPGTDRTVLPESKDAVEVRPLRIRDELAIVGREPEERKRISNHIAHILAPVVSVNDTQAERISELHEWYDSLPPADAAHLEEFIDQSSPHLSQEFAHQCDDPLCGFVFPYRLVLDQDFFRSDAWGRLENRWRQIFNLCWDGKGFTVDLTHVPDDILDMFTDLRNERVREENARLAK